MFAEVPDLDGAFAFDVCVDGIAGQAGLLALVRAKDAPDAWREVSFEHYIKICAYVVAHQFFLEVGDQPWSYFEQPHCRQVAEDGMQLPR